MLFRAYAYTTSGPLDETEVAIFFHAPSRAAAWPTLQTLLTTAWNVNADALDAYNFFPESELLGEHAAGDASTGDARLFESGAGPNGISYLDPQRTLMFVRPATLRRLLAAQQKVQGLQLRHLRVAA